MTTKYRIMQRENGMYFIQCCYRPRLIKYFEIWGNVYSEFENIQDAKFGILLLCEENKRLGKIKKLVMNVELKYE